MSSISNITSLGGDYLLLGQGSDSTQDFNIITNDGRAILLNGIDPTSGSGGGGLPINAPGNITLNPGNLKAQGDGSTTGLIEGENIKSKGNLIVEGSLNLAGGLSSMNIAGNGAITMNTGNISQNGGSISQQGAGSLTVGTGGITSNGEIQTIGSHDIVAGRDFYFDGNDIYKREISGFPPVVTNTNYKDYKGLVAKNDANVFTGANQFNSNTTEFAAKVSVGTRDPVSKLFTQNLALNTSGNIECKTINNATQIQTGTINCGNGVDNEVRARKFITRTNENNLPVGWTISQETPSDPAGPLDNILQIKAGAVGGVVNITDSAYSGNVANIELDPRTTTNGGKITTTQYNVGEGSSAFLITQPKVGVNTENLLIMAGNGTNPKVVFDTFGSTATLMTLEQEAGPNDGMLRVPKIEFGISGPRNRIYNLQDGATNLNLNIQHASASSEVVFQDNQQGEIMKVKKTAIQLGNTIPIFFGNYSFRPQQYSLTKTITIAANKDTTNFTNMIFNCRTDTFTNVNAGGSVPFYNAALEGFYKVTVTQTALSSAGNFSNCDMMFEYVYRLSTQSQPDIIITEPTYNYRIKPTNQARPTIEIDHLNTPVQSQPVFLLYSGQNSGETMAIEVRLTKLNF